MEGVFLVLKYGALLISLGAKVANAPGAVPSCLRRDTDVQETLIAGAHGRVTRHGDV